MVILWWSFVFIPTPYSSNPASASALRFRSSSEPIIFGGARSTTMSWRGKRGQQAENSTALKSYNPYGHPKQNMKMLFKPSDLTGAMWERYKLEHAHIDRYNDPTGWNWYILILFIIDFMTLVFSDLHVGCAPRKQLTLYLGISCV